MILLKILSFIAQFLWYILCIGILLAGLVVALLGFAFVITVEIDEIKQWVKKE